MNDKTRLGLYLLFPPFVFWGIVLLLFIDRTLALYVVERINANVMGIIAAVAGLVFPGTALYVGASCLRKKEDFKINLAVTVLSALILLLLIGLIILFRLGYIV
jgi:hypothetical protein